MMMDAKLKARVEEALGLRGKKDNHAVRFKDISKLLANTNAAEVARIAEKVARDVAEGYDDANLDLSELQADVDEAMQQAAAAAAAAINAQSAANNASAYTDQVSQQVRDDLAVDFAAAVQAVQDAQFAAYEAESSRLTAEANAARIFPSDFRDGARFWKHTASGSPQEAPDLPPGSELLDEAGVGDFIRLRSDATVDQFLLSRGVSEYEEGKIIRITARVRNLNTTTAKLRTVIAILRADFSLRRLTRTSILEPTAPGEWQTIVRDLELPAAAADEVWFRAGVYTTESITPDETVDVAMIDIVDVSLLKQVEDTHAQASIARDDAVIAKEDAESAAAAAQSSLELTAEASGRDMSVLNDTFLVSSDWTRVNSEGALTQLANSVYPIGRDWRFVVTDTQSDGLAIVDSPDTIWIGQTDAEAYVVEVLFTLVSGDLGGAGVRLTWNNDAAQKFYVNQQMVDMQAGSGLAGRARTARGVFKKPEGFAGTFAGHDLRVYANLGLTGWTRQAKTITFHRVSIRPATREELGSGAVAEGVRANLLVDYLTVAQTNLAIAQAKQELSADIGTVNATVNQQATAIATLEGNASGLVGFEVQAGNQVSLLQLMAADGAGTSYSIARISAKDILLEGSVGAYQLVVFDPANLVPDNQFQTDESWGMPSGPYRLTNSGAAFDSKGCIYYDASQATSGWQGWVLSREFSARGDTDYHCEIRMHSYSSPGNLWARLRFNDAGGEPLGYSPITNSSTIETGNRKYTATLRAPSGTQSAQLQFNVNADDTPGNCRIGDALVRAKESAATLILPDSITSPLIVGEAIKSIHVDTGSFNAAGLAIFQGDLRSDNYNFSQRQGWRITSSGTMHMPRAVVGTLEVKDNSITSFEYSYTTAERNAGSNSDAFQTVQTLVLSKGRSDPMPLWYRVTSIDAPNNVTVAYVDVRLRRNGNLLDTISGSSSGPGITLMDAYLDIWTGSGAVTYTLEARVRHYRHDQINGSSGPETVRVFDGYGRVKNRFLGAFNALK